MCAKMPGAGEWYAREVYPYVSVMLSGVASVVPFSLCEVTVLGFVLCLIALPFGMRKHQAPWGKVCVREAEVLLWVYVWFYWAWGMNCKGSRGFALGVCLVLLGLGHELFS